MTVAQQYSVSKNRVTHTRNIKILRVCQFKQTCGRAVLIGHANARGANRRDGNRTEPEPNEPN